MTSIRLRLLLSLLAMLLLAAVVMGALTYRNVLAETEGLFDYQLRQMALSLRDQGEIAADQVGPLTDEQLDFVIQIWTIDGRTIYASRAHASLPGRAVLGLADVSAGNAVWRTFSVATGDRVIQVAQPRQIRQRLAAGAALRSVTPLLLLAPLMALAVGWLANAALAPLRRLAAQVRQRDDRSLEALPQAGLPDELTPLVSSLNALLARLGGSLEAQRAFVSDAAHELRSPLTALKLQVQLLERATDEATRRDALAGLSQGIARATRLVEQLLTLARSEPGAPAVPMQSLDLAETVRRSLADAVSQAAARDIGIELVAPGSPRVVGDGAELAVLVRNLVDNAIRYSPRGARIELRVDQQAGAPLLQVDDSGPGIPAAERERVFDRFYRGHTGDEPGTGLGLAIVRGIATRHRASVSLDDSPLGGLRVTVRFPAPA
jgi:signal transduction histidine kinase